MPGIARIPGSDLLRLFRVGWSAAAVDAELIIDDFLQLIIGQFVHRNGPPIDEERGSFVHIELVRQLKIGLYGCFAGGGVCAGRYLGRIEARRGYRIIERFRAAILSECVLIGEDAVSKLEKCGIAAEPGHAVAIIGCLECFRMHIDQWKRLEDISCIRKIMDQLLCNGLSRLAVRALEVSKLDQLMLFARTSLPGAISLLLQNGAGGGKWM